MAACDRCGARKLKKRKTGTFAGFFWCPMHGPVAPRPVLEAVLWGVPLEVRNAILRRQIAEGDCDREKIEAIRVEMILAYRAERKTDEHRDGDAVPDPAAFACAGADDVLDLVE